MVTANHTSNPENNSHRPHSPAISTPIHAVLEPVCGHTDDRDHLFRSIATSVARALTAPLDGGGDVSLLMAGQAR
jgi:hypothetical protein